MGEKNNQWHPGFVAAMQMEFADNREDLEFIQEHNLSKKPLQIDLLVIKNSKNIVIRNGIGKLFRRYNIIEYKSPDDEMGIDVFYKVNAYACLYKSSADKENLYHVDDITITLFPRATSQMTACWHLATAARVKCPLIVAGYLTCPICHLLYHNVYKIQQNIFLMGGQERTNSYGKIIMLP